MKIHPFHHSMLRYKATVTKMTKMIRMIKKRKTSKPLSREPTESIYRILHPAFLEE